MRTTTLSTNCIHRLLLISVLIGCLALLPNAQAVSPPPDGCYPGFTTAEGCNALHSLTSGAGNTGLGWYSLYGDTTHSYNTGVGAGTLFLNNADSNTAVGAAALLLNTVGTSNTAVGTDALVYNDSGEENTATGRNALYSNTTGFGNTAIGFEAGANLTTGQQNVCIGWGVGGVAGESNTTRIRNIGATPIVGGITVVIDGIGPPGDQRLGFPSSSRRYKEEIKPMDKASETLFALKPVTFRAKGNMDPAHVKHYGLIAEDVAAVDCDLVVYNPEGKPETVRYEAVNAMLLNEFLKVHRQVQEQQKQIEKLTAQLKEQAKQIRKVNDKVEMNRTASKMVVNNQ